MPIDVPTRALSVRSPWWWFILNAKKDVENRNWATNHRGPVLLHASSWWRTDEVRLDMRRFGPLAERNGAPPVSEEAIRPHGGAIVGIVEITDCVTASGSPWFFGPHGFVLAHPVAFARPIPCKGALGFFRVPAAAVASIREELATHTHTTV